MNGLADATLSYAVLGVILFTMGLHGAIAGPTSMRRIIALTIMSTGAFMTVVALGYRSGGSPADPVPHAIVLTGLVVSVSTTALALALVVRIAATPRESDDT